MARFSLSSALLLLGLAALSAVAAPAQVFTPTFMSPRPTSDIGVYVSDFDPGELALEGIWRRGTVGLRLGFVDIGDGALSLGGEIRNPVVLAGAPVGIAFTAGAQGIFGDDNALGVQGGFSIGHTFAPPDANFTITPYVHPRLAAVNGFGGADDFDVDVLADLGFDVDFSPNLSLRLGINLGDGADWGVGFAWRQ